MTQSRQKINKFNRFKWKVRDTKVLQLNSLYLMNWTLVSLTFYLCVCAVCCPHVCEYSVVLSGQMLVLQKQLIQPWLNHNLLFISNKAVINKKERKSDEWGMHYHSCKNASDHQRRHAGGGAFACFSTSESYYRGLQYSCAIGEFHLSSESGDN